LDHLELILFGLLVAVAALSALAHVLDVPYPILLVVGGCLIGFVPGVPDVQLDPDLVLLIFLPPLLFHAASSSSIRDLRRNLRPIMMSAIGVVLLTMVVVAVVAHAAIDGLPWAAAFALGAIVSPTDPLAASAIARRLGVPRRVVAVIEGESLINDGTALVAYRTAVAAAVGGSFSLVHASGDFVLGALGGIAVGWVAAEILTPILRRVDDEVLAVVISLCCGYAAYLPAEELGLSGVLAAVTVGLVLGHRASTISTAGGRLRAYAFWDVLVFLLNALLFTLVGLQLPAILDDQSRPAGELIALGALISAAVFLSRLVWANTMPYVVRVLDRRPSQLERRVGWRLRLVTVWAGMRGAVSLAAALALPKTTDSGAPFPERDLLIFLTLCVIFWTLVGQGLTFPVLIRRLGIEDDGAEAREELHARKAAARAAIERLEGLADADWTRNDSVERMRALYDFRRRRLMQVAGYDGAGDEDLQERSLSYQRLVREVLEAQRQAVLRLRDDGTISDEVMHRVERDLDLEDERLEI
jgi:CPA1 family monovalent cation:H+ antiporter